MECVYNMQWQHFIEKKVLYKMVLQHNVYHNRNGMNCAIFVAKYMTFW